LQVFYKHNPIKLLLQKNSEVNITKYIDDKKNKNNNRNKNEDIKLLFYKIIILITYS